MLGPIIVCRWWNFFPSASYLFYQSPKNEFPTMYWVIVSLMMRDKSNIENCTTSQNLFLFCPSVLLTLLVLSRYDGNLGVKSEEYLVIYVSLDLHPPSVTFCILVIVRAFCPFSVGVYDKLISQQMGFSFLFLVAWLMSI